VFCGGHVLDIETLPKLHTQQYYRHNQETWRIDNTQLLSSYQKQMNYMLLVLLSLSYQPTGRILQYRYARWACA
jgi:hypothetical protein